MGVQVTDSKLWQVLKAGPDFHHLIHNGHFYLRFISRYVSSPKKVGGMAEIEAEHRTLKLSDLVSFHKSKESTKKTQ